jgi:hypothetical protein
LDHGANFADIAPDGQQLAREVTPQVRQEMYDLWTADRIAV